MRVVFDTNILISGFITPAGNAQYLLTRAVKYHTLIFSNYILKELKEKLAQKIGAPGTEIQTAISFLKARAVCLEITGEPEAKFSDQKDLPILRLIEVAKAHYFVTGDKKLLGMKKLGSTVFLSLREAMEVL